jgi:hypothetical protein
VTTRFRHEHTSTLRLQWNYVPLRADIEGLLKGAERQRQFQAERTVSEEEMRRKIRTLVQDLRTMLAPNGESRDWGQVGLCQRLITTLELMTNTSELAKRWSGDPTTPLNRIVDELGELREGWTHPYVEMIQELKEELMR